MAVAALAAGLGLFGLFSVLWSGGLIVQFVVPDNYRGIFRLTIDQGATEAGRDRNGVWVYRIPESGALSVKRRFPFSEWHRVTAVFASGELLAVAAGPPAVPYSDEVRLHSAGSTTRPEGRETMDFFVGTDVQMVAATKAVDPPLGGVRR